MAGGLRGVLPQLPREARWTLQGGQWLGVLWKTTPRKVPGPHALDPRVPGVPRSQPDISFPSGPVGSPREGPGMEAGLRVANGKAVAPPASCVRLGSVGHTSRIAVAGPPSSRNGPSGPEAAAHSQRCFWKHLLWSSPKDKVRGREQKLGWGGLRGLHLPPEAAGAAQAPAARGAPHAATRSGSVTSGQCSLAALVPDSQKRSEQQRLRGGGARKAQRWPSRGLRGCSRCAGAAQSRTPGTSLTRGVPGPQSAAPSKPHSRR